MPNDAIIYYRQAFSLNNILAGGRIDKISMPAKDVIELYIRAKGSNHCLLLSAEPSRSRIQLTKTPLPTLPAAPSFLMHLRKHIGNGKILSVENLKYERLVKINIAKTDELFDATEKHLILEIIGKYSNIILVNSDGKISESIKHIPLDATSKRQILPGMIYTLPPTQNKLTLNESEKLSSVLSEFGGTNLYGYIMSNLAGFSPVSIKEAIYRVFHTKDYSGAITRTQIDDIIKELSALYEQPASPCIYYIDNVPVDFCACEFTSLDSNKKSFPTLDEAMDVFFASALTTKTETNSEKTKLMTELRHTLSKEKKKIANFELKKIENNNYEDMRIKGELITANLYRIPLNSSEVTLDNYYTGEPLKIALDDKKTPQQNAQNYFKKYSKMKKTVEMCILQIEKSNETLDIIEQILHNLNLCSSSEELDEVFTEAEKYGFHINKQHKGKKKNTPSEPIKLNIQGYEILIGKNSLQNDRITKAAKSDDIWLHACKIPGSHLIIKNSSGTVPDSVIETAATYCAYFSKAVNADKVPIDYTFKKYVSKPADAPTGKVVYTNQKTIYVSPQKPSELKVDPKRNN